MSDCEFLSPGLDDFTEQLDANAFAEAIPYKGVFELTARCNFNCKMCYIHMDESHIREQGRELTNEEWLEIARQARDAGMLHLNLTGGEIFVRPHFRELYEALSEMGFLIQLQSNGYMIDEKVMEWLSKCPPYAIRFTLYGSTNEVYEAVCGVKDGFDRVDHAIDLILEAGIPFYMLSTIIKENQDDLQNMYEYAMRKGVPFDYSTLVVNPVRGAQADAAKHRIEMGKPTEEQIKDVKKVKRLFGHHENPLAMCNSYRKGFWMTWDGKMQMCTFMEKPSIKMEGKTFAEAWNELIGELESLRAPKECDDCKYEGFCKKCPGMLAAQCGAPDQVNDAFCEKAKLLYDIYYDENA